MKQVVTFAFAAMTLMAGLATASGRKAPPADESPCRGPSTVERPCSAAQQAGWRVPLPAGTRVIELPAVSLADRAGNFVRMLPDLVVGGDVSDPDSLFYRATQVAVDDAGWMYIADAGNHRIQVFDGEGVFVRSLGRRGQGPGELELPLRLSVVGGKVFVWDIRKRRFVTWDTDGTLGPELSFDSVRQVREVDALDNGSVVLLHPRWGVPSEGESRAWGEYLVQSFSVAGVPGPVFLRLESPFPKTPYSPYPAHAVDPSGVVYVSTADEYQILALDASSGEALWALRVDAPQESSREKRSRIRARAAERNPTWSSADLSRYVDKFKVPDQLPAIEELWVDGHGHLYVVTETRQAKLEGFDLGSMKARRAIDVYSREGERLFSGFIDHGGWTAAKGNHVYGRDMDAATEEATFVRFLLREPFK